MSSPYPILNNRPIDQWKVTELKEELRKRSLKINGLKEELVRRLADALHTEMEETEKEELDNGIDPDNDPEDKVDEEESVPVPMGNSAEQVKDEIDEERSVPPPSENSFEPVDDKSGKADNDAAMVDNIDSTVDVNQITDDQGQKEVGNANLDAVVEDTTDNAIPLENRSTDSQTGAVQLESSDKDRSDEQNEDTKPSAEDAAVNILEPTNQVSEVSTDLGFQVKSDSISTDSVSINEKNELKGNLNANNVHLELEVVKPEMVQPSSSNVPTIGGDSHELEDGKELVDNQASLGEAGDVTCATDMEVCKKIEGVDEGSPEKLNLDRSSGDESMEEDVLESKQIESKNNSEEGDKEEDVKDDIAEAGKPVDAMDGGFSPEKEDIGSEEEIRPTAASEKRKAEDQEAANINNEPKRQRRWNIDTVKAPELQTSSVTTGTPKDVFQPALRRSFTRSNSLLSGDAPKERIVPPSQKPATTSLRIDRFLRPFTLKAVQELLAKTGTVTDFWMDQIKTHCYVTYSSVDEAIATRNALYNLQWPTNGGRQLVAEFVDPQEVKMKLEAPPQSPAPITPGPTTPTATPLQRQPQVPPPPSRLPLPPPPSRLPPPPSHLPPPPPLPPPPALANLPPERERLPPPPPLPKKPDPPIMTLDDLFKKTKATPRIYYLPLSDEQVAAKMARQGKRAM